MRKLTLAILLTFPFTGYSQAVVGYYPFSSLLALSSNTKKPVFLEARLQTNSIFSSLNTEIAPMVVLNRSGRSFFYAGGGLNLGIVGAIADSRNDLLQGYFLSVGTRVQPIAKTPQLTVGFEVSPYAREDFKTGVFRTLLGLQWQFKKKK